MKKSNWSQSQFKKSSVTGDTDTWKSAASGIYAAVVTQDEDMLRLGITELSDLKQLTRARNKAMFNAHPDQGGSDDQARAILEAYERLKARLD